MQKLGNLSSRLLAFLWNFTPRRFDVYIAKALAFIWLDVFGVRRDIIYQNLSKLRYNRTNTTLSAFIKAGKQCNTVEPAKT